MSGRALGLARSRCCCATSPRGPGPLAGGPPARGNVEYDLADVPDGPVDTFHGLPHPPAHFWALGHVQGAVQLETDLEEVPDKGLGQRGGDAFPVGQALDSFVQFVPGVAVRTVNASSGAGDAAGSMTDSERLTPRDRKLVCRSSGSRHLGLSTGLANARAIRVIQLVLPSFPVSSRDTRTVRPG